MAEYIVHKAVDFGKIKKSVIKKLGVTEVNELSGRYMAQKKYDGCCAIIDPEFATAFSRTGECYVSLHNHVKLVKDYFEGYVLIGEAWHPELDFSEISGRFRRGKHDDKLHFVVNDVLTTKEFWDDGQSTVGYADRMFRFYSILGDNVRALQEQGIYFASSYNAGTYGLAQNLCNDLVEQGGYDGLILRDPNAGWTKGDSGSNGEIVKVKRVLSFDLRITGFSMGKGKLAGMVGAINVNFFGKTLSVNGGTNAQRKAWAADPSLILGKICEVEAMDYSSEGLLREPRFKGLRFDKLKADDE